MATKVFISYARKDGTELANRLFTDLERKGFEVWIDTRKIAGGASWSKEIENALDRSSVVLALLTPGSYISEICRAEQLRSLRKRKYVIPVLAQHGCDIPLHLEAKNYRDFTGAKSYAIQLGTLVEDIRKRRHGVELKNEFRVTYVMAPPLPRNYVSRPDALERLRNALIADGGGSSIAVTALKGMGGIGKTVLAQALCHDEVVQHAFPDGIIWITAGKECPHELGTRMREVGKALNDDLTAYDTEPGCINRYRTVIREKAALVVIDDVWSARDVEPFRAESPRSRLLFTTRDASIAAALGADECIAGLPTDEQCREVLARWSGLPVENLPSEAASLIGECGRLPLALSMIGAMLRGKPRSYWEHVRQLLKGADLAKIKTQFPDYPHADLLRAIQISVDSLDAHDRERYLALAVLLEDMSVHPAIQRTIWATKESDALEAAERFVSLSLAQRHGEDGSIRLHDLQLDYARSEYSDKESLHLINSALRLSLHIIHKDPFQFGSQLIGRLLLHDQKPAIRELIQTILRGAPRPWIRPLGGALEPPGSGLVRTLEGHSEAVYAAALTSDGRRVVTSSHDKTVKVWDLDSGKCVRTLEGHSDPVRDIALSRDDRLVVSASWDHTLRIWDLGTGCALRVLKGHSAAVNAVDVTPDGRCAVSASDDKTLKLWELGTGRELRTLKGHSAAVNAVDVTPDGRCAVSASDDKTLKLWELGTGRELRTLKGHSAAVNAVDVSPDGRFAISASDDWTLRLWDLEAACEIRTLGGHSSPYSEGPMYTVAFIPDRRRAICGHMNGIVKIWDLETGCEIRKFLGDARGVYCVAVTADGHHAVSTGEDKALKVWDLEAPEAPGLTGHSNSVDRLAVSPDGARAISSSSDGTLKVWDLETCGAIRTLKSRSAAPSGLAVTPDGKCAVSGSLDGTLTVWNMETGCETSSMKGHSNGAVYSVAITPNGKRALSTSDEGTLTVWNMETGRGIRTLDDYSESELNDVAISPDGKLAVSASDDCSLTVWNIETGRKLRTLKGHSSAVYGVAISPDGRRLLSASGDDTLKTWDLETGREMRTLRGHSDSVTAVAISPDGRLVASASWDETLKVWNPVTGTLVATFTSDSPVFSCVFSAPRTVVAGDAAGRVHFLSLELDQES